MTDGRLGRRRRGQSTVKAKTSCASLGLVESQLVPLAASFNKPRKLCSFYCSVRASAAHWLCPSGRTSPNSAKQHHFRINRDCYCVSMFVERWTTWFPSIDWKNSFFFGFFLALENKWGSGFDSSRRPLTFFDWNCIGKYINRFSAKNAIDRCVCLIFPVPKKREISAENALKVKLLRWHYWNRSGKVSVLTG